MLFEEQVKYVYEGRSFQLTVEISSGSDWADNPLTMFDSMGKIAVLPNRGFSYEGTELLDVEQNNDILTALKRLAKTKSLNTLIFVPLAINTYSSKPFQMGMTTGRMGADGFIYCSKKDAASWYALKNATLQQEDIKTVLKGFESDLSIFNAWLVGDVFNISITVEDEDGNEVANESCGGFYGDDMLQNGIVDFINENIPKEVSKETVDEILAKVKTV